MTGPAVEVFSGEWHELKRIADCRSSIAALLADCIHCHYRSARTPHDEDSTAPSSTSSAACWARRPSAAWMSTLDYKVAYYDPRRRSASFPSATGRRSTSSGTSTSCFRSICAGTATWRCCLSRHRDAEILSHAALSPGLRLRARLDESRRRGGAARAAAQEPARCT